MLSLNQLKNVCCMYQGSKECRFLRGSSSNYGAYNCEKLRSKRKAIIDAQCEEYIKDCSKQGVNPYTTRTPLGDNCQGYPILNHVEQGYDK